MRKKLRPISHPAAAALRCRFRLRRAAGSDAGREPWLPAAGALFVGTGLRCGAGGRPSAADERVVLGSTRRERAVVAVLALEDVAVDRCQHFVQQAVDRLADEVAQVGALPRDDVEHFRQLAVAGDLGGIEFEAVEGFALGAGFAAAAAERRTWRAPVAGGCAPKPEGVELRAAAPGAAPPAVPGAASEGRRRRLRR